MLILVIDRPGDSVAVFTPMRPKFDTESWADYYADIFSRQLAKAPELAGLPYAYIEQSELPPTREHRDRWRLRDGRVVVVDNE